MPRRDPVARKRLARRGDVDVRLGVDPLPGLDTRFEQPVFLELPRAPNVDAGVLAERLEVYARLVLAQRDDALALPLLASAVRELFLDDAQRQELRQTEPMVSSRSRVDTLLISAGEMSGGICRSATRHRR